MQKWKITQIFINLPPQKQVVAGLLFTVLCLASVVSFEELKISKKEAIHKAELKAKDNIIKSKDSSNNALQNRYLDFMEREINTRFQFKNTIDSLKIIQTEKK